MFNLLQCKLISNNKYMNLYLPIEFKHNGNILINVANHKLLFNKSCINDLSK
jgi:hypothetical protein